MLSIIIVNYNVKYFLEQCLCSVQKAIAGIAAEVIVIDNNSADGSVDYLQEKFSWVKFIANKENTGYAKANNQGWAMAAGKFVLFLNPDTILSEDCLIKSVSLLEQDQHRGALGIRMIDGSGRFLPESRRGFPTPLASFFKLSGLIKLFPRSKIIARYYLGHLPENENQETEVLAGAYLMIKKDVLEKTGGFDESFFMYGEDIDLSYRINEAGYKNYYLADSSIIHFKGESTKKGFRYTTMFYQAMGIFVSKHYKRKSYLFSLLMQLAITISGILSFARHFFSGRFSFKNSLKINQAIVAGSSNDAKKVIDALTKQLATKRNIHQVQGIAELSSMLQKAPVDEIIFCAGVLSYQSIIDCIENLRGNADYKFYASGSKSIVGSMSGKDSGEAIVL